MSIRTRLLAVAILLSALLVAVSVWRSFDASRLALAGDKAAEINRISSALLGVDVALAQLRGRGAAALANQNAAVEVASALQQREFLEEALDRAETVIEGARRVGPPVAPRFAAAARNARLLSGRLATRLGDGEAAVEAEATLPQTWFQLMIDAIEANRTLRRSVERGLPSGMNYPIAVGFEIQDALWETSEYVGRERGLIAAIIAEQRPQSLEERRRLANWRGIILSARDTLRILGTELGPEVAAKIEAVEPAVFRGEYGALRQAVRDASDAGQPPPVDGHRWFDVASAAIQMALDAQQETSTAIAGLVAEQQTRSYELVAVSMVLALIALLAGWAALWVVLMDVSMPLAAMTRALNDLAAGRHDTQIPALERRDEMGRIAAAAQVFRQHAIELDGARVAADAAARAKSGFLAMMSHEIRTPMNGVLGMLNLLEGTRLTADQREMLDVSSNSARTLLTILDDILDFSKIEAGKLQIDPEPTELESVVGSVLDLLAPRAWEKGLEINLDLDPGLPALVQTDPSRLRQILLNLTGNAIKFTEHGTVTVRMRSTGPMLRTEIEDTGIGLSDEQHQRLFRAFEQAEVGTTRRFGGTGLGLAICRRLVELMGGTIGVESLPGLGSTFWFELPLEISDTPDSQPLSLDGIRVRFDPAISGPLRVSLHIVLSAAGATVTDDAGAGVVLLVDGGNGDAWQTAPHDPAVQPVVLLLNRGSRTVAEAAQHAGVQAICWKPVRPISLRAAVATAAGRIAAAVQAEIEADARWDQARAAIPAGVRILVAEDHPSNRIVIRKMLERLGVDPVMAEDGAEALQLVMLAAADGAPFDMVITDCHMPVSDGFEFSRQVRALEADQGGGTRLPIVALSASVLPEEIRSCYEAGMDDFLYKPVDPVKLHAALKNWLPHDEGKTQAAVGRADVPATAVKTGFAVLDLDQYIELFGGLTEEVVSIARGYADGTRQQLDDLAAALAKPDLTDGIRFAHLVAGGSLTIGALRLGEHARSVERMLRAGDLEGARAAAVELPSLFEDVAVKIDALRADPVAVA